MADQMTIGERMPEDDDAWLSMAVGDEKLIWPDDSKRAHGKLIRLSKIAPHLKFGTEITPGRWLRVQRIA